MMQQRKPAPASPASRPGSPPNGQPWLPHSHYYPTDPRYGSSESITKDVITDTVLTDQNRIRDYSYRIDFRITVVSICRNSIRGASSTGSDSAHYSDCRDRTQVRYREGGGGIR